MRSKRMLWLVLGLVLGIIVANIGTYNGSRTRQVTYKKSEVQYVNVSIQETYDHKLRKYYLQLFDGSIYFLNLSDYPPDRQPPTITEHDAVSLVYDADDKEKIQVADPFAINLNHSPTSIEGEGYRIVEITTGYASLENATADKDYPNNYPSKEYLEHPKSYSLNSWSSWTGSGLLIGGAGVALLCVLLLYWEWWQGIVSKR